MGNMNIHEAADKYDALMKTLGVQSLSPAAYYLAQCRNVHDRPVLGPTITFGWPKFVASDVDVASTKVCDGQKDKSISDRATEGVSRLAEP